MCHFDIFEQSAVCSGLLFALLVLSLVEKFLGLCQLQSRFLVWLLHALNNNINQTKSYPYSQFKTIATPTCYDAIVQLLLQACLYLTTAICGGSSWLSLGPWLQGSPGPSTTSNRSKKYPSEITSPSIKNCIKWAIVPPLES